ncbi:Purine nucleoside phosphorylase [Sorochytrium milnesiophthora]
MTGTTNFDDAKAFINSKTKNATPAIGIVCGSGLGGLVELLADKIEIHYEDIPGFVKSTVAGHAGKLVFGQLGNKTVVCMVGRFHPYEGWTMAQVTLPIRVMAVLGIKVLIVTNAAGGLNPDFNVGDMVIIEDHIGLPMIGGLNPLVGPNLDAFGPRFVPTSDAYPRILRKHAFETAAQLNLLHKTHTGIYCFVSGPQYETRAECRLLRSLGGDTVGMSTVPEVVVARHSGVQVLGISLVTNKVVARREESVKEEVTRAREANKSGAAANATQAAEQAGAAHEEKANHEEVLQASRDFANDVRSLVKTFVETLDMAKQVIPY